MRFFLGKFRPLSQICPAKFKNHSQLPNIYILLSFFGSLFHHFKYHRVDILFFKGFSGVRGDFIWVKFPAIEAATDWNRIIPWKFKYHSQLPNIYLFIFHFWTKFLIISRSTELIFYLFKFFCGNMWGSLVKSVGYWGSYGLKQGNQFQNSKNNSQLSNCF